MIRRYAKLAPGVLIAGLLITACGSQSANTPSSSPTGQVLPATEAPTDPPPSTDTAAPTEPATATEAPATQPALEGATVSFANDVMPIIQSAASIVMEGIGQKKAWS